MPACRSRCFQLADVRRGYYWGSGAGVVSGRDAPGRGARFAAELRRRLRTALIDRAKFPKTAPCRINNFCELAAEYSSCTRGYIQLFSPAQEASLPLHLPKRGSIIVTVLKVLLSLSGL